MDLDANLGELNPSNSTDDTTLDVAEIPASEPSATADSSSPQGATEDTTLSIVRDVVAAKSEDTAAASPAEGQGTGEPAPDQDNTKKEPDDENYSDVPFNKHPRFQQLLRKAKRFEEDAGRYNNVQTFMDNNGITPEEAADGFVIMGLIKTNPAAAWEKMKPIVQQVLIAAGEVLPDDLQQRVSKGELTHDAALEVSRSRATVQSVQAGQSFAEQRAQRLRQQSLANNLISTATAWEQDRRLKDPNFEAKLVPLQKELAWIQTQEGKPSTPEGVTDQLKRAYAAVSVSVSAAPVARPKPAVQPRMGTQISGTATAKPESTLDIIRQVRAARS